MGGGGGGRAGRERDRGGGASEGVHGVMMRGGRLGRCKMVGS